MKRKLNSDDLGELGQTEFARWCASAGLIANKSSDRDRTGWDFRIEYSNQELDSKVSIDKRNVPLPIMVQVKSVWKKEKIQFPFL